MAIRDSLRNWFLKTPGKRKSSSRIPELSARADHCLCGTRNLDLRAQDVFAHGETPEEALEELKEAIHVHLATSLYYNLPIPKPKKYIEFAVAVGNAFHFGDEFDVASEIVERVQSISIGTSYSFLKVSNHPAIAPSHNFFFTTTPEIPASGNVDSIVYANNDELHSTAGQI